MDDQMTTVLVVAAAAAVLLNLFATYTVARSYSYTAGRKVLQMLVIWLLPVLGAAICIIFARMDALATPAIRPQEFCENVDASGSDH